MTYQLKTPNITPAQTAALELLFTKAEESNGSAWTQTGRSTFSSATGNRLVELGLAKRYTRLTAGPEMYLYSFRITVAGRSAVRAIHFNRRLAATTSAQ